MISIAIDVHVKKLLSIKSFDFSNDDLILCKLYLVTYSNRSKIIEKPYLVVVVFEGRHRYMQFERFTKNISGLDLNEM